VRKLLGRRRRNDGQRISARRPGQAASRGSTISWVREWECRQTRAGFACSQCGRRPEEKGREGKVEGSTAILYISRPQQTGVIVRCLWTLNGAASVINPRDGEQHQHQRWQKALDLTFHRGSGTVTNVLFRGQEAESAKSRRTLRPVDKTSIVNLQNPPNQKMARINTARESSCVAQQAGWRFASR
jgi:hypothetical protein